VRTKNPITVLGPDGRPLAGAQVYTRIRATGADATVFAGETGGTLGDNPATTDDNGRCVQWLERGQYASTITADDLETFVEPWDSAPAGDSGVDTAWLAPDAVTGAKIGAGAVAYADLAADILSAFIPIGGMIPFAGAGDPAGGRFLLADGRTVSGLTYVTLNAQIGSAAPSPRTHAYNGGVSPGVNLLRLPDKRGRVSVGADDMGTARGAAGRIPNSARVIGQNGGEERHTLLATEMPVHAHTVTLAAAGSHSHGGATGAASIAHSHGTVDGHQFLTDRAAGGGVYDLVGGNQIGNPAANTTVADPIHAHGIGADGSHTHTPSVGNAGSGGAHNVMQPNEIDNVLIRVL
jgi:microcystin-dependent protein